MGCKGLDLINLNNNCPAKGKCTPINTVNIGKDRSKPYLYGLDKTENINEIKVIDNEPTENFYFA